MRPLRIALYGDNGHQLHRGQSLTTNGCDLLGYAGFGPDGCQIMGETFPDVPRCADLDALLGLPDLDLIVLCSPKRSEQAAEAIRCLEAGVHVYAEKPCACSEAELDRILAAADAHGRIFHEMAGTVFDQPWWAMKTIVESGRIGTVQQILVQKSYPFYDGRPTNEDIDGGLIAQNAVHALRFVEQVTGLPIVGIEAMDATIGESRAGSDLRMVATFMGSLEGGALFAGVANYCNQPGFGSWGNEMLRIWGTAGMIEAVDGGRRTRLVCGETDHGAIDVSEPAPDFFAAIVAEIVDGAAPLLDRDAELHPTRMVLRAAADARARRL